MIFRDFIYLNNFIVDEYISQLDGSLVEGFEETNTKDAQKDFKVSAPVGGGATSTESQGITKHHLVTPQARFTQLYDALEKNKLIQFLDAFDEEIWKQIRKDEIVEIQANIRVPKVYGMMNAMPSVSDLLGVIDSLKEAGQMPNVATEQFEQQKKMISGISSFADKMNNQSVSIIFEAASTPEFSFVSEIKREYLRLGVNELQVEAKILGKVTRIIPKGHREIISPLMRDLLPLVTGGKNLTSKQEREAQVKFAQGGMGEIVEGPAMKIGIIAIYN